jgi:RNA polymerase sigma-70 factor (ECF subfamily)
MKAHRRAVVHSISARGFFGLSVSTVLAMGCGDSGSDGATRSPNEGAGGVPGTGAGVGGARAAITASQAAGPRAMPVGERSLPLGVNPSEATSRTKDFDELYAAHVDLVRRMLRRRGIAGADLKDLTQKVFLIAFVRLSAFEGRSALSTWLHGICRRVVSGYRRSAAARYERSTDPNELAESIDALETRASELVLAREEEARRALAKLPESQRIVFVMSEVEELAGREIASLLNISIGTVRSRLRFARKALRREVRRLAAQDAFQCDRSSGM